MSPPVMKGAPQPSSDASWKYIWVWYWDCGRSLGENDWRPVDTNQMVDRILWLQVMQYIGVWYWDYGRSLSEDDWRPVDTDWMVNRILWLQVMQYI